MKTFFLITLLFFVGLISSCDDNSIVNDVSSVSSEIEAQSNISIWERCPQINYIKPGTERNERGWSTIEACYYGLGSSNTSYELFYRDEGSTNEDDWKSLGWGGMAGSFDHTPGRCQHVIYELSRYNEPPILKYNQTYQFKAGSTDPRVNIYRYYHYKKIDSDVTGYDKRYVTLDLTLNISDKDNDTYDVTVTIKDDSNSPGMQQQTKTFHTTWNRFSLRTKSFETAFYCSSSIPSSTGGNITVNVKGNSNNFYDRTFVYRYGYEYPSRYLHKMIDVP